MFSDPLGDLLIRIKNAVMAKHKELELPGSRQKQALIKVLADNGYVGEVIVKNNRIVIKNPRIKIARRLSKPGSRQYVQVSQLPRLWRGRGLTILSTSKGLMTAKEAFKQKLGGELLCRVG